MAEIDEAAAVLWFREAIRIDDEEGEVNAAQTALLWADALAASKAALRGATRASLANLDRAKAAEAEVTRLKAEVERRRCNDLLCRCCTGGGW